MNQGSLFLFVGPTFISRTARRFRAFMTQCPRFAHGTKRPIFVAVPNPFKHSSTATVFQLY